jgi:hypothetical protein
MEDLLYLRCGLGALTVPLVKTGDFDLAFTMFTILKATITTATQIPKEIIFEVPVSLKNSYC